MNVFSKKSFNKIKKIKIGIASSNDIKKWSYGEVKESETINYKNHKPIEDGLFCAKIFGPLKDYTCICGKHKGRDTLLTDIGTKCSKCLVDIIPSRSRRERMGHIKLAFPVVNILFWKSLPNKLSILLDIPSKTIEAIIYLKSYIVTCSGSTGIPVGSILPQLQCDEILHELEFDDREIELETINKHFQVESGGTAIRTLLKKIDISKEKEIAFKNLKSTNCIIKKKKIIKKINFLNGFLSSSSRPEDIVLEYLPVLPADLRPLVELDGNRHASSDMNTLYANIINRNKRAMKLLAESSRKSINQGSVLPIIMQHHEHRLIQESVDSILCNSSTAKPILGSNKRPLKSITDSLKGKSGRFRANLLGKRVDYSGRSVIVIGPNLKINECGIPKKMALELFKPMVVSRLEQNGFSNNIKNSFRMIEEEAPEVFDVLEEITKNYPVILNRAPSLHRLSMQAFYPVLTEGKAIQLHPLACSAFNADFDGDQMAIHIPLCIESILECICLMMRPWTSHTPANGDCIITPSQEAVTGIYYLTRNPDEDKVHYFSHVHQIKKGLNEGVIKYNSKIKTFINGKIVESTAGRMLLKEICPDIDFSYINKELIRDDIDEIFKVLKYDFSPQDLTDFANNIMKLGFEIVCKSGLSIGKDDVLTPELKDKYIEEANKNIDKYKEYYNNGLMTEHEKNEKSIDEWVYCQNKINKEVEKILHKNKDNSLSMMVNSKARGSTSQMTQMGGMRGVVSNSKGEILKTCITSSFKEGLNSDEYFISTSGSRKGLIDTAIKTAESGYLSRKLIDCSRSSVVNSEDCGCENGLTYKNVFNGAEILYKLEDRIIGRFLQEDIKLDDGSVIKKGEIADQRIINNINNIEKVKVRTPITCEVDEGVCAKCFGLDLSCNEVIDIGSAVGVIASQSIGQPATQLTMNTFHHGGSAQKNISESMIFSSNDGSICFNESGVIYLNKEKKECIVIKNNFEFKIIDKNGIVKELHKLIYGSKVKFSNNSIVKKEDLLAEVDLYSYPLISQQSGKVNLIDFVKNKSYKTAVDEFGNEVNIIIQNDSLSPLISIQEENGCVHKYDVPIGSTIFVKDAENISRGHILSSKTRNLSITKDIIGGLEEVINIFEIREPKNKALMCEIGGVVSIENNKSKKILTIENKNEKKSFVISKKDGDILLGDGSMVDKGDFITNGEPSVNEMLDIMGVEFTSHYLIEKIQEIYYAQGIKIHDKHIEVIIRQMLNYFEVVDSGDSTYVSGSVISRNSFYKINKELAKEKKQLLSAKQIILGITKCSLSTDSFISAASFQETVKVITDAAICGMSDELKGSKESIIVGHIQNSGTGFIKN